DIALLSRVPVLASMGREALRLLAFAAETRQLRAGDILFRKGDTSDSGYVVAMGAVAMMDDEAESAEAIVGPGSLIGEMALISQTNRPATAMAREPTTVLRISRPMFRRTLEEYPQVAQRLAINLRDRVQGLSKDIAGIKDTLRKLDT